MADNDIRAQMTDVTFEYQPGVGVYDLDLAVRRGSIMGLIGPSGCGKTTTVRLLLGLLKPQQGQTRLLGQDSLHLSSADRERIGYMPQHFVLYPDLTVDENLRFAASLYGVSLLKRGKIIRRMLETVQLSDAHRRLARDLSGGMQRRLELAASLLHEPELIFADEPTSGIDPVLRGRLWDYLRDYRAQGKTMFVTTQYVGEAAYCDLVGVMAGGRLLHLDTPENLYRKALGGEIITITVEPGQLYTLMGVLRRDARILRMLTVTDQPGTLHLTVDNSGEMIPQVLELVSSQPDLAVRQINRYEPSFDEIFADLIQQKRQDSAPGRDEP
ncbi:MAG: ATP-binding cassette domain-containing protein [Chloroflexota bacterium]